MPIPCPEESSLINTAAKITKNINKDEEWPPYIRSPFPYITVYCLHQSRHKMLDWDLRGATIDFNLMKVIYYSKQECKYTAILAFACDSINLYFNPTYAICQSDSALKGKTQLLNIIYSASIQIKKPYYTDQEFTQKIFNMALISDDSDVSKGIAKCITEMSHRQPIRYSHKDGHEDIEKYWWDLALHCDPDIMNKCHANWRYYAPYEYYHETGNNGITPISVFAYGTEEDILKFDVHVTDNDWAHDYDIKFNKREFTIPIEKVRNIEYLWNFYLINGLLNDCDIIDMLLKIEVKLGVIKMFNRLRYPGIVIRPDYDNIDGSQIGVIISNSHGCYKSNKSRFDLGDVICHINHWETADIKALECIPAFAEMNKGCVVHPSIRNILGGKAMVVINGIRLISSDAEFPEHKMPREHLEKLLVDKKKLPVVGKYYEFTIKRLKKKQFTFLLCANRMEMLHDLSAIIRSYMS